MAKPVYLASNVVPATDTFREWMDRTNLVIYDMGTYVLTTSVDAGGNVDLGGTVTGNSYVSGYFSANTLIGVHSLRGGNNTTTANLNIASNVHIGNTTVAVQVLSSTANVNFTGANVQLDSTDFRVNANTTLNDLLTLNDDAVITGNVEIQSTANIDVLELNDRINTDVNVGNSTVSFDLNLLHEGEANVYNLNVRNRITDDLTVRANGSVYVSGTPSTHRSIDVYGNTVVRHHANVNSLGVEGDAAVHANLDVDEHSSFTNTVTMANTLAVTGAVTLSNTVNVTGTTTLGDDLDQADSTEANVYNLVVRNDSTFGTDATDVLTFNAKSGQFIPTANGILLGNTTHRWTMSGVNLDLTGTFDVDGAVTVNDRITTDDLTVTSGNITGAPGSIVRMGDGDGVGNYFAASTDGTTDLGTPAKRWENIYSEGYHILKSGALTTIIGSSDGLGVTLVLDGNADGDGGGSDYAFLRHSSSGDLLLLNHEATGHIRLSPNAATALTLQADGTADFEGVITTDAAVATPDAGHIEIGGNATQGGVITGSGSGFALTLQNESNEAVLQIPTGTRNVSMPDGDLILNGKIHIDVNATDPYIQFTESDSGIDWSVGVDNNVGDEFVISNSTSPSPASKAISIADTSRTVTVHNNLVVDGNVDLGDNASDTISMVGVVDTSLRPASNGAALGDSTHQWNLTSTDITSQTGTITGDFTVDGDMILSTDGSGIIQDDNSSRVFISGGSSTGVGGNIVLHGGTHGVHPGEIFFRTGTTTVFGVDAPNNRVFFNQNTISYGITTFSGNVFFNDSDHANTYSVHVRDDLDVDGVTTLSGEVFLGDATSDDINFVGRVDTSLEPSDSTKVLGNAARRWNMYATDVDVSGNVDVVDTISAETIYSVNTTGQANLFNAIVRNTLTVSGSTVLNGGITLGNETSDNIVFNGRINTNIEPTADGMNLGHADRRWDVFAQALDVDSTATFASWANVAGTIEVTGNSLFTEGAAGNAVGASAFSHVVFTANSSTANVGLSNNTIETQYSSTSVSNTVTRVAKFAEDGLTVTKTHSFEDYSLSDISVTSGGTGYNVGDKINITGVTSAETANAVVVANNGSGAITDIAMEIEGNTFTSGESLTIVTDGGGTGATFNITRSNANTIVAVGGANAQLTVDHLIVANSVLLPSDVTITANVGAFETLDVTGVATFHDDTVIGSASDDVVSFNARVDTSLTPIANGTNLGSSTQRWHAYGVDGNFSGDMLISGFANVISTLEVGGTTTLNNTLAAGNTTITGDITATGNGAFDNLTSGHTDITGDLTVDQTVTVTGRLNVSSASGNSYIGSTHVIDLVAANVDVTGTLYASVGVRADKSFINDGTALNPAFSWISDTDTGMWRSASGVMNFSSNGVEVLEVDHTSVDANVLFRSVAGTAGAPAYSFTGDTNTGMFQSTNEAIDFSTAGAVRMQVDGVAIDMYAPVMIQDGSVGAPSLAFRSDPDTGMWLSTTGRINMSAGGAEILEVDATSMDVTGVVRSSDGTVGAPAYSFYGDTDTGMWSSVPEQLDFATNGTNRLEINAGVAKFLTTAVEILDGTAATPSLSFVNDDNTGLFRIGTDEIGVSTGGTNRLSLNTASLTLENGLILRIADGNVTAPGIIFDNDNNTGIYRIGADNVGISAGGTTSMSFNSTSAIAWYPLQGEIGSVSTPGFAFNTDTNTGIWSGGSGQVNFSSDGIEALEIHLTSGIQANTDVFINNDKDLVINGEGFVRVGPNHTALESSAEGGGLIYSTASGYDGGTGSLVLSAAPTTDTHVYIVGGDTATVWGDFDAGDLTLSGRLMVENGSSAAPGISFSADNDIGMFRNSGGRLAFAYAGVEELTLDSAALHANVDFRVAYTRGYDFSTGAGTGTREYDKLQDYGSGYFTATLADAETGGNTAQTATARYTKIGNMVTVRIQLGFDVDDTGTGIDTTGLTGSNDLWIRGLPFAARGALDFVGGTVLFRDVTHTNDGTVFLNTGDTAFRIVRQQNSGSTIDFMECNELIHASSCLYITFTYEADVYI